MSKPYSKSHSVSARLIIAFKNREVMDMIEDALLLYLESLHRERGTKKKKERFPF